MHLMAMSDAAAAAAAGVLDLVVFTPIPRIPAYIHVLFSRNANSIMTAGNGSLKIELSTDFFVLLLRRTALPNSKR